MTALRAIAAARAPFVSRGDRSGTDALEKRQRLFHPESDVKPSAP